MHHTIHVGLLDTPDYQIETEEVDWSCTESGFHTENNRGGKNRMKENKVKN